MHSDLPDLFRSITNMIHLTYLGVKLKKILSAAPSSIKYHRQISIAFLCCNWPLFFKFECKIRKNDY